MYSKGVAVIVVTRDGIKTALKIKEALIELNVTATVYAPKKYASLNVIGFDGKLSDLVNNIYKSISAIVAVMATGIIIRAIIPHLQSKLVDPAVIGVDVSGKFVISLISGHYGGANELAEKIAQKIKAIPVITTASDVLGKQSIDDLARKLHLTIINPDSLVPVNAAFVNGDRIVLVLIGVKVSAERIRDFEIRVAENLEQAIEIVNNYDAGAIITKQKTSGVRFTKPVTILKPQQYVIGLGARKEISIDQIFDAINRALTTANISLENVAEISTVDIKKDSQSMIEAVSVLGFDLKFISVDELRAFKHEELSPDSKIVQKNIGIGGVCERAALITAGKNAQLTLKKQKLNGVTVAIAKAE
jgi:cobalt-precorrin 5A hydrolase